MSAPEERWWSVRAGEYVLGTLRGEDLQLFETVLSSDTELQASVAHWERRLAGLNETVAEQPPGEHVWPQIRERLRVLKDLDSTNIDIELEPADQVGIAQPVGAGHLNKGATVVAPHESSAGWQSWAGLATAACILLGISMMHGKFIAKPAQSLNVDGVAVVLSDESGEPFFLVETDSGNLRVRVTALSPPALDSQRDFQLWQALPDRSAVRPVALLPEESGAVTTFKVDSLVPGSDLFGVSIEPVGAATDAGPTGPVVAHGDYLATQQASGDGS